MMNQNFPRSQYQQQKDIIEEDVEEDYEEDFKEENFKEVSQEQYQQILRENQRLHEENQYLRNSHTIEIENLQKQLEETNQLLSNAYQLIEEKENTIQYQLDQLNQLQSLSNLNESDFSNSRKSPRNNKKFQSEKYQQSPNLNSRYPTNSINPKNPKNPTYSQHNEHCYSKYFEDSYYQDQNQNQNQEDDRRNSPQRLHNISNKQSVQQWYNHNHNPKSHNNSNQMEQTQKNSPRRHFSPNNHNHNHNQNQKKFEMDEEPVIYSPRSQSVKKVLKAIKPYDDQIHFGETDCLDREIIHIRGMTKPQMFEMLETLEAERKQLEKVCNRAYSAYHGATLQKEKRERERAEDRLYIVTKSIGKLKQALSK